MLLTKRILAFLIDHLTISLLLVIITGIYIAITFEHNSMIDMNQFTFVSFLFWYPYMLIRDVIFRRSIGKKIMKLSIQSDRVPVTNKFKLVIRNATLIIFPIEVLVLIITKGKTRLGDLLANTSVEMSN